MSINEWYREMAKAHGEIAWYFARLADPPSFTPYYDVQAYKYAREAGHYGRLALWVGDGGLEIARG